MKFHPEVIIFDVDGVLVDTRGSFQRTTLETVKFFTGKRVTARELHKWKNRPGFNDDWKLSTAWVQKLGFDFSYEQVKAKFVELYWGEKRQRLRQRRKMAAAHSRSATPQKESRTGHLYRPGWEGNGIHARPPESTPALRFDRHRG